MALAAFIPVVEDLKRAKVNLVIVAAGKPSNARKLLDRLGFELPGRLVFDPEKNTHQALALKAWGGLPKYSDSPDLTYGVGAFWQALRVHFLGPDVAHGNIWQQGGIFELRHDKEGKCLSLEYEWREEYPGDYPPVVSALREMGIETTAKVNVRERLAFVMEQRQIQERGGSGGGLSWVRYLYMLSYILLPWLGGFVLILVILWWVFR